MTSWLRGKRHEDEAPAIRPEVAELLPPSVRRPEASRVATSDGDAPDDGDDADLDFLAALASEVDRKAAQPGTAKMQIPLRGANPRIDDMQVFREMKDDGNTTIRFDHHIADVDMGDLLEELNTVQAALRGRRAA